MSAALIALLAVLLFLIPSNSGTAQQKQKLVIVLSSIEPGVPEIATLIKGIREGLVGSRPTEISIYVEHLDRSTANGAVQETLRRLLAERYRGRDPDLVIALGSEAIDFSVAQRANLWPTTPIVFSGEPRLYLQPVTAANTTGVIAAMDIDRTIDTALRLFPKTKRVALVSGSSDVERRQRAAFMEDFKYYRSRLDLVELTGKTLEDVRDALATLDDETVAYFLSYRNDATGRRFVSTEVLDVLAPSARRPIFGTSETYFGHGIIGGWLIDYGQLGREVSVQASRVLFGEQASAIPVERSASIRPMFDWRSLQRWGVDEEALPAGSVVFFKQPTLWERYRVLIMSALSALVLQAALIGLLLWERGRRRRAEAKALRLSGEVILAAESERARIARELHDDVSQRLALLSIELAQVDMAQPALVAAGNARSLAAVGTTAQTLSGKAQEIAGDLYRLAKELQPASLKHLGLIAATRAFAEEIASRHRVRVTVDGPPDFPEIPETVATTLYRIVQEGLQNTVKHSGATEARVTLAADGETVTATISDNGRGFAPSAVTSGTGLFGMRERVRLIDGTIDVRSSPGAGTVVHVRVPRRPK